MSPPPSLQSQAEVRSLLAAAEAEVEAIKAEGGRRLEDCTAGLREKLGEAEEALQVRVISRTCVVRHFWGYCCCTRCCFVPRKWKLEDNAGPVVTPFLSKVQSLAMQLS